LEPSAALLLLNLIFLTLDHAALDVNLAFKNGTGLYHKALFMNQPDANRHSLSMAGVIRAVLTEDLSAFPPE